MASIDDLIDYAQQNVADSLRDATTFVNELETATRIGNYGLGWQEVSTDKEVSAPILANITDNPPPTLTLSGDIANLPPEVITAATIAANLNAVVLPTFDSVAPVLSMPARPDATLPTAPSGEPEFNMPVIPVKPEVNLPALPVFNSVNIPSAPTIELPTWNETAPNDELLVPTNSFTWNEAEYTSELLDTATGLIKSDLENGGYGIDARDEQALWERAKDREMQNADAAMQDLSRSMAARGFTVPQGAMLAGMQKVQQQSRANISTINRDISLKRADLYVQARQFAITTGLQVEQFLISYHAGFAERALNAAKYIFDAGVTLFDMQVKRYNAKLQLYQTVSQVYESQIRAALSKMEIFKAEIDAARLTVGINESQINLYKAQLSSVEAVIGIYETEMQAANVAASMEKLKLEAFRERVDMYSTQIKAKSEEFGMYESAIRGEMSKVDVYKAETQAFETRLNAAKIEKDISRADAEHQMQVGKFRLAEYDAAMERFKVILDNNVRTTETELRKYGVDTDVWKAQVETNIKQATFELDKWAKNTAAVQDLYKIKINEQSELVKDWLRAQENGTVAAGRGLQMYERIIETAQNSMSAITTLAG